jgi:TolB-like protein/sterol desaturase/sphingolipid hydroxylase (fatty acid hydroxylase superfamily)/class 3 adenylate cyclase
VSEDATGGVRRRLAAIVFAGYKRLQPGDEASTLTGLTLVRTEIIEPQILKFGGRIIRWTGDDVFLEFPSVVEAVRCAAALNEAASRLNDAVLPDRRIALRIGINLDDVIIQNGDLFGDGVNIAARLEALAEPGTIYISGAVYDRVVDKVDFDFIELGPQSLKNISRPIRVYRTNAHIGRKPAAAIATSSEPTATARFDDRLLPFVNFSDDPEQEFFADGITEDIITMLAGWRAFPVIARGSTFNYKGQAVDVKKVGEELDARYVVEGSVRKSGRRVRVNAQLIRADTNHHIMARRYDRDLNDLFELQDEIVTTIGGAIEPERIALTPQILQNASWDRMGCRSGLRQTLGPTGPPLHRRLPTTRCAPIFQDKGTANPLSRRLGRSIRSPQMDRFSSRPPSLHHPRGSSARHCRAPEATGRSPTRGRTQVTLAVVLGGLVLVLFAEAYWPRRRREFPALRRRLGNLGFWLFNLILGAFVFASPVAFRPQFEALSGIFLPTWPIADVWLSFVVGFLLLDLLRYGVHRCKHAVPFFWRFHALHHSDPDLDVTTSVRQHPGDYLIGAAPFWAVVILLDIPATVALSYGIAVFAIEAIQHGNIRLPERLDRCLQPLLITVDLHLIHHSIEFSRENWNYGAVFSVWDRLFGTYQAISRAQIDRLVFGVRELPRRDCLKPSRMILTPWLLAPTTAAQSAKVRNRGL